MKEELSSWEAELTEQGREKCNDERKTFEVLSRSNTLAIGVGRVDCRLRGKQPGQPSVSFSFFQRCLGDGVCRHAVFALVSNDRSQTSEMGGTKDVQVAEEA